MLKINSKGSFNPTCVFCKIINGEIPSYKLIETKYSYAMLDVQPISKAHALIIPKYHGAKMHHIPDEFLADILPIAKKLAKAFCCIENGSDEQAYNIIQNNGRIAHQMVDHVHFHFVPKLDNETGLGVVWPVQDVDPENLSSLAKELVRKIEEV